MVKMDLGESNKQASSTATMTSSRVAAYTNFISSLGNLSGAEGLSGSAYDSAKTYASSVMVPLVQGGILLSEALSEAMTKFPADYSSKVAPESLDSEELQEQIDAYQRTYDNSLAWYNTAKNNKSISAASLESAQRSMMGASSKIEELKEKKRKLEAFDATSSSIFDTISSLETAVVQGLSVAQGSFGSYNGIFTIPSQSGQMDWAKTINTQWESRQNKQQNTEKIGIDKEGILKDAQAAYEAGEIDESTFEKMKNEIKEYGTQLLVSLATTSTETGITNAIEKINSNMPNLAKFWSMTSTTNGYFKNSNINFDANGYSNEAIKSVLKKVFKYITVNEVPIPIPITNSSINLSGTSAVFLGVDYAQNLTQENAGRALTHTVATAAITSVGISALNAGITGAAIEGSVGATYLAGIMLTNPIGWAVLAGVGVGIIAGIAYNKNVFGIKEISNDIGDNINKEYFNN
ncbi:LXG domain-containing protein [Streptococcus uberis]|uniref:LXG domain-containing protein n=1 Tax=Streptococcus uberis TaxID=1349 RepID=UPI001FF536CA|nr:LXG domain-containing protein [Streptococcus uberis]MCK1162039.1 LXG domain-containing protein [Streptococcus uberis]MCK1233929.1 LXG domain-containing protein [Streptococcus uberis]MCK1251951.1 LXG domain-containing protein [Streptococcus uberis]